MPANILVVDDEQFVRDLLVKILQRKGHEVRGVADGQAALDALAVESWDLLVKILARQGHNVTSARDAEEAIGCLGADPYDLVLTDVVMPGTDGFDLLRRVKSLWPGVKVIVLTGFARRQNIADFLLYGADEYIAKPFQVHELLASVDRVLADAAAA